MKKQRTGLMTIGCCLGLLLGAATGCTSMEDRIAKTIAHEVEDCRQSDELFYEVNITGGGTYEVLSELCHLEQSEVVMRDEYLGRAMTGPIMWTAGRDETRSDAVLLTRAAWPEFNRAWAAVNSSRDGIEPLQDAEEHFAKAEAEYGDSAWVREQRLKNLLALRTEEIASDDGESILGDRAEAYLEEVLQWSEGADDREAAANAHLAAISHIGNYITRQKRFIDGLGSSDERLEAAVGHAEDDGDMEAAQKYRDELETQREQRPEERKKLEERIEIAEREACEFTQILSGDGIEDDSLRQQISTAVDSYDCEFDDEEEIAEDE